MRAIVITSYGGLDGISVQEVDTPPRPTTDAPPSSARFSARVLPTKKQKRYDGSPPLSCRWSAAALFGP